MAEIPTVRVGSSQPKCDTRCEFPVAERPAAIRMWLESEDSWRGERILLAEPDCVWARPLKLPAPASPAIGFHFHYIEPLRHSDVMHYLHPGVRAEAVPRTGPAPFLATRDDILAIVPRWEARHCFGLHVCVCVCVGCCAVHGETGGVDGPFQDFADKIEQREWLKRRLGWVREMYAFALATVAARVPVHTEGSPASPLISQVRYSRSFGYFIIAFATY